MALYQWLRCFTMTRRTMPVKTASAFMTGMASSSNFLSCHRLFALYPIFCPGHPLRVSIPRKFVLTRRRRRNCSHLPRGADPWLGPLCSLDCMSAASRFPPFRVPPWHRHRHRHPPHILTDVLVFRSLPITRMARPPLRAIDYSTSMPLSLTHNPSTLTCRASSGPSIMRGSSHHHPKLQST